MICEENYIFLFHIYRLNRYPIIHIIYFLSSVYVDTIRGERKFSCRVVIKESDSTWFNVRYQNNNKIRSRYICYFIIHPTRSVSRASYSAALINFLFLSRCLIFYLPTSPRFAIVSLRSITWSLSLTSFIYSTRNKKADEWGKDRDRNREGRRRWEAKQTWDRPGR